MWGGSGGIRGAASDSDSDSLKESVRTLTQEQTSRDTKKAFWMPSPRTSAGRHSGLPQQPAAAAAGAPWATVRVVPDEAGAGGRRPRSPPRRKAKGTHYSEEVEEVEAVGTNDRGRGINTADRARSEDRVVSWDECAASRRMLLYCGRKVRGGYSFHGERCGT